MVEVVFDRQKAALVVWLTYNRRLHYQVVMKPDVRAGKFTCVSVTTSAGTSVRGDERYQIETRANKELMAWFLERLKPEASHVSKVSLPERIKIAFAVTLMELDLNGRRKLSPLGKADLGNLQTLRQQIAKSIVDAKKDARKTGRKLEPDYFQSLKRDALKRFFMSGIYDQARRDFYSTVLTKAFAWKNDKVPKSEYDRAMRYLQGFELAFELQ